MAATDMHGAVESLEGRLEAAQIARRREVSHLEAQNRFLRDERAQNQRSLAQLNRECCAQRDEMARQEARLRQLERLLADRQDRIATLECRATKLYIALSSIRGALESGLGGETLADE